MLNFFHRAIAGTSFLLATTTLWAQAPLDIYNSFTSTDVPSGWGYNLSVNNGNLFYYGGSDNTPSVRLDGTGEFVRAEFAESPEEVSFYIRSTGFNGPATSPGTLFTVQESTDGTNWNNLQTYNENNLEGDFAFHSHSLNPMARYVRFYYTQKMGGSNIALDEVSIIKAPANADARMMLWRNGEKVLSGHSVDMSETTGLTIQMENEGLTEALSIESYEITGTDASHFQVEQMPAEIPAMGASLFELSMDGEENETYSALLSIVTNDLYNPTYEVFITGYGGSFAPAPETNLSGFSVENMSTYGFDISWNTSGPAPEKYVVLQSTGAPVANDPEDGLGLDRSEYLQNARVVYVGSATQFRAQTIGANTEYHYRIYAANGQGQYTNYKQEGAIGGAVTTPVNLIGDYYDGMSAQSTDFVSELSDRIFPHTQIEYFDYPNTLIIDFETRDTTDNRQVVTGYYTGYEYIYEGEFSWSVLSREHVFPHSWFTTYQAFDEIEYTDFHNLFPVHNDSANMPRLNHPFGVVESEVESFLEGKLGWSSQGDYVYEPRDFAKGRAARAVFYMVTCYNNQIGGGWALPTSQDQQLLKDWHFQYPPDGREMARNDYIDGLQGNRNPFIDSLHYACYIDFDNMTYIDNPEQWCIILAVDELDDIAKPTLYPNPNNGSFTLRWNDHTETSNLRLELWNTSGQVIWSEEVVQQVEQQVDIPRVSPGYYILQWNKNGSSGRIPLLVQPNVK